MRFDFVAALAVVCVAACQPMYKAKPQKLKTPDEVARPIDEQGSGSAAPVKPKLDENCGTDRKTRVVSGPVRDVTADAESKRVQASRETDGEKRARLAAEAVEGYRSALAKDPFDQTATLGLAIAYDMLHRKGCAIDMLERIGTLAKHPAYAKKANQLADDVKGNDKIFVHYRTDAERAVGR